MTGSLATTPDSPLSPRPTLGGATRLARARHTSAFFKNPDIPHRPIPATSAWAGAERGASFPGASCFARRPIDATSAFFKSPDASPALVPIRGAQAASRPPMCEHPFQDRPYRGRAAEASTLMVRQWGLTGPSSPLASTWIEPIASRLLPFWHPASTGWPAASRLSLSFHRKESCDPHRREKAGNPRLAHNRFRVART